MLGSLLFIHLADVRYSVELVVFILFFSALSTFFTVYIFKNQFIAENEERENKLKQQIEYNACHFSTIINNLPLIAYIINKDYKFITGNSEALKFFGDIENCHFRKLTVYQVSILQQQPFADGYRNSDPCFFPRMSLSHRL